MINQLNMITQDIDQQMNKILKVVNFYRCLKGNQKQV